MKPAGFLEVNLKAGTLFGQVVGRSSKPDYCVQNVLFARGASLLPRFAAVMDE
jgi:hypothetical protein